MLSRSLVAAAALATALTAGVIAAQAQAPASGADLYKQKCNNCHKADAAAAIKGPDLDKVVGRKIASVSGYAYSDGLKAKSGNWTEANLDAFLTKTDAFAPGTKMKAGSQADAATRKAIIEHLKTLK